MTSPRARNSALPLWVLSIVAIAIQITPAQQQPPRFGGAYSGLEPRRQKLIDNWVSRFVAKTGQKVEAGPFYDEFLSLSTKTTFDAVTHALMTTQLTDRAGASLGDALALVEQVDSIRGEVAGAPSDRQFRMYVRLVSGALDTLGRSQQFKRTADNAVYHQGFPTSYRERSGAPSIQFSVALDARRADIDVDYRASAFPVGLFNGHLTASNSDVRAGSNYDKHTNRWSGFQNWWRGFFGSRQQSAPAPADASSGTLERIRTPRAGRKNIEVMANDFLTAWLVEGNIIAAMGYVSDRSYACLAQDSDNPADFDRGVAPFQLMTNLKAAYDSLGPHSSLDGLIVGTRFAAPMVRVVRQPHHAQFVIYSIPDDVAVKFDCESRLTLDDPDSVKREYGNYAGATFLVAGRKDDPVALLWAKDDGYWKIVSWKVGSEDEKVPAPDAVPTSKAPRIAADPTLVQAGRSFLENWLVRKNYDAAFASLSPKAYDCYNLERGESQPPAPSSEEAGRRLRAALETAGKGVSAGKLEAMISAAEPIHPATKVMDHPFARVFSLSSIPNALADAAECAARAAGSAIPDPMPLEYGNGFGMTMRFKTRSGDAPILRLMWRKEGAAWRITSYGVELP